MVKFLIEYFLIIFIGIGIIWKLILPAFGIGTYLWEKRKAKQEPKATAEKQFNETNESNGHTN